MEFQNTSLWAVVENAIIDLERNQDLKIETPSEYVIGYLCKQLVEEGVSVNLISN
jgi:hypothetical protein